MIIVSAYMDILSLKKYCRKRDLKDGSRIWSIWHSCRWTEQDNSLQLQFSVIWGPFLASLGSSMLMLQIHIYWTGRFLLTPSSISYVTHTVTCISSFTEFFFLISPPKTWGCWNHISINLKLGFGILKYANCKSILIS